MQIALRDTGRESSNCTNSVCANHIMHSKERPPLTFTRLPAVSFSYKKWRGLKKGPSRVPFAFICHLLGNNAISRHYRYKNEAHMAVLCICEAFGQWVAPFISNNIQLECISALEMSYLFQSVSFGSSDFSSCNEWLPRSTLNTRHTYKRV